MLGGKEYQSKYLNRIPHEPFYTTLILPSLQRFIYCNHRDVSLNCQSDKKFDDDLWG